MMNAAKRTVHAMPTDWMSLCCIAIISGALGLTEKLEELSVPCQWTRTRATVALKVEAVFTVVLEIKLFSVTIHGRVHVGTD